MTEFVFRYEELYGTLPPWDIWAIDLYPIDWWNLPNTGFTPDVISAYSPNLPPPNESIPVKQLVEYRAFIDSLTGKAGQPIMITELGIHWGWTEIESGVGDCVTGSPAGEYRPIVIRDYFDSVFSWLDANAISNNIERWFTYVTHSDIAKCRLDGYAGMSLLESAGSGSALTDIGRWYVARSSP